MEILGLTAQQAEIVAERGRDILVTAGAGSGKTRVLVERYISLLDEHRIPQIAAVTFTDAAATEMRERVRREVLSRPELAHHRADLDEAVIGTIHSLCHRILREHPVQAAIDPASRVLSEDESELELVQACFDALEDAADGDDRRALALREMGVFAAMDQLRYLVARRDEVASAYWAMGADTASWGEHVRARMDAYSRAEVERVRPRLVEQVQWLRGAHAGPGEDALSTRLRSVLLIFGDPSDGDWSQFRERAIEAGSRINLTGGSAKNWNEDLDEVKAVLRGVRDTANWLKELPCWNDHDQPALEILLSLRALFEDACRRYEARKRELAALDFADLEIRATQLLSSHPDIAASCRARFRHLMVDELQDTNPSQIALLSLLGSGGDAGLPRPECFFVGDVKQAIYRFRGGDVRHFARLRDSVQATGAIHELSQSFRAHDPLVETLNVLFGAVLNDAKEEFEAPMQAMTGRGTAPPRQPHLVLLPVSGKTPSGETAGGADRRRVEADAVAKEVAELLRSGAAVWDRDRRESRPARPSDVAVLLRRLTNVHLFEQALEGNRVPYRTAGGAGFFTRQEVLDLTNLLGWLAEPEDAIALVGALRSPLFMIDDQTLLALRSGGGLLAGLRDPPVSVRQEARPLCKRAAEVLQDLRGKVPFAAADALLERALELTGFEAAWAAMQGGDQALANIRKFVGLARTLAGESLDEFVTYVHRRRDELAAREGQAALDDADVVRLLTVHGAKGLQFPIVFVPEAHLPSRETYDYVRWRAEEGISLTLAREVGEDGERRRPGFYSYLFLRDREEEAAEHKRLFYVAATRAADALYISGDFSDKGEGWLTAAHKALSTPPPDGVEVRDPIPVDVDAIARRPPPGRVPVPPEEREVDIMPPLVSRPPVVPLRASTPVTALKPPTAANGYQWHGDGLGLVRGSLAHRAIELWFTTGERPGLAELASKLNAGHGKQAMERVVADVDAMLDRFDASDLAATLRAPRTRAYFEMPFSWDWEGVPVHGTMDLVYETGGVWNVLDFKADEIEGRSLPEAASPYLPQLALYAAALERATGQRPVTGFVFLRTGDVYAPPTKDLSNALAATRALIGDGQLLEMSSTAEFDESSAGYPDL